MIRDYERVARQLESVIDAFNEAYDKKQRISITKACNNAGVHVAWLYRILNNIADYKISDEQLSRYEEIRDRVFSEIIQKVDEIAHCGDGSDSEFSIEGDIENSGENIHEANASDSSKQKDSGNRIARDALRLKHEQWKLKNLLPKHFNDGASNSFISLVNNDNRQINAVITNLSIEQLRALASIKMIGNEDNHE